jgi:hypothetical protein
VTQQVFWLSVHCRFGAFPCRFAVMAFVTVAGITLPNPLPDYSGGTAAEFNRIPGCWSH